MLYGARIRGAVRCIINNEQMDRIVYDLIDVYMEISSLKFLESWI